MNKLSDIAGQATADMLAGEPYTMRLPPDWVRPRNWPLPIKREMPGPDGYTTQQYRAIAVLEWVNEQVQAEAAAERMAEAHASGRLAAPAPMLPPPLPVLPVLLPLPQLPKLP